MILRSVMAPVAALFLVSVAAFFLLVPVLSIMTIASILAGLTLMFGLGFHAGTQRISQPETIRK